MTTIQQQIANLEATRAAKAAAASAILEKGAAEGRSTDEAERADFDTMTVEIETIDGDLSRFRKMEAFQKSTALTPVGRSLATASDSRSGERPTIQVVNKELPKGIRFARFVGALAAAKGNRLEAAEFAKRWKDSSPEIEAILRLPVDLIAKAAVDVGTTTDSDWAAPLVQYQNLASEFLEYLRPLTIVGRINGLRRVPFKVKIPRQTGVSTVSWVGEAKPKPISQLAFDTVTFEHYKIAGIVVMTEELVRFSNPAAEGLVRDDLANSITQLMDYDFVDPAKALSANVSPASITNGVSAIAASGTTADAFKADVQDMFAAMLTAGLQISNGVFIMTQANALALGMMANALDQPEFPGVGVNGGTLFGFPVITSNNIPATPVTGGYPIIFALPSQILYADDGGVNIDMSREASLQMDSAPTSPPDATTVMVSLWQHNMVGIRAERFVNWLKARTGVVQYISGAKYGQ